MSEEHSGVSRRATLKSLGAAGAVLVLGRTGAAAGRGKADDSNQEKQATNVVDVAVGRFTKGHS